MQIETATRSIDNELNLQTSFFKPRILVVEDDHSFQPFWESVLSGAGLNVTLDWATSKEQAEAMIVKQNLADHPYEVVISDIWLDGRGTGIDLWNQFGEGAKNFIFISGLPISSSDLVKSLNFGMPVYLHKPLSKPTCQKLIQSMIDQQK